MYQGQHQQKGIVQYFYQYIKRKVGKIQTTTQAKLIRFVLQTLHKILNKNLKDNQKLFR